MASVKDTFNAVISDAIKNVDLVSDNYQKAMALASIAQALAATGLIGDVSVTKEEAEEKKPAKTKKTADKMKRQPKDLPAEEAEETPVEKESEKDSKKEWTEEWTNEAVTEFADDLQYITEFTEKWGEEAANSCLADYSEGILTDVSVDINPLNIKGVVAAFRKLEADSESAA